MFKYPWSPRSRSRTFNWRVIEELWCNIVHLRHSAGWSSIGFNYRVHDLRTLHRFKKPFRDSETRETRTLSASGRGAMVDMLQETMRVGFDHLKKKTPWFEGMEGYFETCFGPKTYRHDCTCFQFFVQSLVIFRRCFLERNRLVTNKMSCFFRLKAFGCHVQHCMVPVSTFSPRAEVSCVTPVWNGGKWLKMFLFFHYFSTNLVLLCFIDRKKMFQNYGSYFVYVGWWE